MSKPASTHVPPFVPPEIHEYAVEEVSWHAANGAVLLRSLAEHEESSQMLVNKAGGYAFKVWWHVQYRPLRKEKTHA